MKKILSTLVLTLTALTLASVTYATETLSPCQTDCLNQHQTTVETLLKSRPSQGEDPLVHRDTVLKAIDALNACVKACDQVPAPAPAPAPAPTPTKKRR